MTAGRCAVLMVWTRVRACWKRPGKLAAERGREVQWLRGSSHETGLPSASLSLVTAFNAIHHFSLDTTLPEVARISGPRAMFVVYTRLHEQEADHVWGRHFPDYLDHSINPARSLMESFGHLDDRFELMETRDYAFQREVDVDWILEQTRSKYYSTLGRYGEEEFNRAFEVFVERLRNERDDANLIRYPSSYSLFLYRVGKT